MKNNTFLKSAKWTHAIQ